MTPNNHGALLHEAGGYSAARVLGHPVRHGPVDLCLRRQRPLEAQQLSRRLSMLEVAGVELFHHFEKTQVVDSTKRHKRQNRYFRQSEVHGGYTDRQCAPDFGLGAVEAPL